MHGLASQYLTDDLHCAADITSRQQLRSVSLLQLEVLRTRLVTVGDRTLVRQDLACGSTVWNSLLCNVVETFCQHLKLLLFSVLFPGH